MSMGIWEENIRGDLLLSVWKTTEETSYEVTRHWGRRVIYPVGTL